MCCVKVEYDEVGEVGSMFVLTAKDEELIALEEGRGMAYTAVKRQENY